MLVFWAHLLTEMGFKPPPFLAEELSEEFLSLDVDGGVACAVVAVDHRPDPTKIPIR